MKNSGIEWTNDSNNPVIVKDSKTFYCAKVSKGCENCYSEVMSRRLAAMGGTPFYPFMNMKKPPELELKRDMLASWAKKKRPRKIFVSSMTDVFGEFVPKEWIFEILDAMIAAPIQTFQVLTKRAKRMRDVVNEFCDLRGIPHLPANIWCMNSVENQACADERIPYLLETKCMVRGLSCEPLLGPIDLECIAGPAGSKYQVLQAITNCGGSNRPKIDWVICGGESGHNARPMHPDWALWLRDQCKRYGTAFFFKQWGNFVEGSRPNAKSTIVLNTGEFGELGPKHAKLLSKYNNTDVWASLKPTVMTRVSSKHSAGSILDDKEYKEFPEMA